MGKMKKFSDTDTKLLFWILFYLTIPELDISRLSEAFHGALHMRQADQVSMIFPKKFLSGKMINHCITLYVDLINTILAENPRYPPTSSF